MNEACDRFMQDPEGERDHALSCADCSTVLRDLDRLDSVLEESKLETPSIAGRLGSVPVAPWEGASHRSWRLVVVALAVLTLSFTVAFLLAGISPLFGFVQAVKASLLPTFGLAKFAPGLPQVLADAPASVRFGIAVAFVVTNIALVLLLRRGPKGYDAARR